MSVGLSVFLSVCRADGLLVVYTVCLTASLSQLCSLQLILKRFKLKSFHSSFSLLYFLGNRTSRNGAALQMDVGAVHLWCGVHICELFLFGLFVFRGSSLRSRLPQCTRAFVLGGKHLLVID